MSSPAMKAAAVTPKLSLSGLSCGYGAIDVITDLSLAIEAGEIFALMGKNGMGKTTLLKTVIGLIAVRSGAIELDGRSITGQTPPHLIAHGVGYAPQ
jgi:ABC-type branched-subunit amino acid transport system ATPase component